MHNADDSQTNRLPPGIGVVRGWRRWRRGLVSLLLVPIFPLGRLLAGRGRRLDHPSRERDGLTLVFTGIQGESFLEHQIALGLADAGVPGRIAVVDWTTRNPLRLLQHLRSQKLAGAAARSAAEQVAAQLRTFPEAPVYLVGYSGGGYIVDRVLRELPDDLMVTAAVMLAPAVSPRLDVSQQALRTRRGYWNFWSPLDFFILGAFTGVAGNCDGPARPSAGLMGFRDSTGGAGISQIRWRLAWLRQFHYGGHFGYASRVWAGETLGPIMLGQDEQPGGR